MDKFDKKEYVKSYNSTNRKRFSFNISNEEYDAFYAYCTKFDIVPTAYIKKLVNDDVIRQGLEPFFREKKKV